MRTFNRNYEKNIKFEIKKISDEDWEIISNENINFYKEQISRIQRNGLIPKDSKDNKITTNLVTKNNIKNSINKNKKVVQKNKNENNYIWIEVKAKIMLLTIT